jgi:ABC-2 type transport system permease protein
MVASTSARVERNASIAARAFLAICWRDIFVTVRQFPVFLAQVLLQPIFFLFIFGRILPDLGFAKQSYATLLLPGIISLTIVLTALQSTALPLVLEFSFTREIEDRLLAPLPVAMVAVEKMLIASVRGLIGGAVIFPLGAWIIGSSLHLSSDHIGLTVLFCVLAALVGGGIGMALGTLVEPSQINIMFALILTPLFFTGCTQYPWALLGHLRWFQIVTLFNPMTYASEGLRAALVPQIEHMKAGVALAMLCATIVLFGSIGIWGFVRRAID